MQILVNLIIIAPFLSFPTLHCPALRLAAGLFACLDCPPVQRSLARLMLTEAADCCSWVGKRQTGFGYHIAPWKNN